MDSQAFYTTDELASYLRLKPAKLLALVHQDKVPSVRLGNHHRFPVQEIQDWINEEMKASKKSGTRR